MTERPAPTVGSMSNAELDDLIRAGDMYRGKALFALVDRARNDQDAASRLARLSYLPLLRNDRLFHSVSLAWVAIIGLLATEDAAARSLAYRAYRDLDPADRDNLLQYLGADRIEQAHPPHPR